MLRVETVNATCQADGQFWYPEIPCSDKPKYGSDLGYRLFNNALAAMGPVVPNASCCHGVLCFLKSGFNTLCHAAISISCRAKKYCKFVLGKCKSFGFKSYRKLSGAMNIHKSQPVVALRTADGLCGNSLASNEGVATTSSREHSPEPIGPVGMAPKPPIDGVYGCLWQYWGWLIIRFNMVEPYYDLQGSVNSTADPLLAGS